MKGPPMNDVDRALNLSTIHDEHRAGRAHSLGKALNAEVSFQLSPEQRIVRLNENNQLLAEARRLLEEATRLKEAASAKEKEAKARANRAAHMAEILERVPTSGTFEVNGELM